VGVDPENTRSIVGEENQHVAKGACQNGVEEGGGAEERKETSKQCDRLIIEVGKRIVAWFNIIS